MKRKTLVFILITSLLLALFLANVCIGSVSVSFSELLTLFSGKGGNNKEAYIVLMIRLPRIVTAMLLGGALALSGYMLQTFFNNPIAGPYVLGISSGAKLLVALLMVGAIRSGFYYGSLHMILAALAGSILVTLFVLKVSTKVRNMSILIVCGVMVGYVCSAITELVISLADDANIVNLHSWSMGSFSGSDWKNVKVILPIVIMGFIFAILISKKMEAYSFGEEYATSLGINVKLFRAVLIIASSILSATVTAFAGPISFVGIAVPHIMREIFKSNRPLVIIPASFLGGGIFCLLSDLLARTLVAPTELSISTMTAIFGAPIVIMMLIKKKRN